MSYLLAVKEILGFAIYIEERGYEFYVEAMKKFSEPRATQLFQYLADEEFKHKTLFKKLQEQADDAAKGDAEADAEYQAYMKEFVKAHQLGDKEAIQAKLARISSLDEILDLAMGFEKDSIVFFSGLKEMLAKGRTAAVERVIHEEMDHLRKIFQMKRESVKK
ncbi:MAG: ferritin family protein [Candidatus Aminicenantes bacterium]|nr:ferritin family protein [Candidatus Aminicenantes bacterium]